MLNHLKHTSWLERVLMCVFLLAILSLSLSSNVLPEETVTTLFNAVGLLGVIVCVVKIIHARPFFKYSGEEWLFYGVALFSLLSLSGVVHSEDVLDAFGKWGRNLTLLVLPLLCWVFKNHTFNWAVLVSSSIALTSVIFFAEAVYLVEFENKGRNFSEFNPITLGMFTATCAVVLGGNFLSNIRLKHTYLLLAAVFAVVACFYSQTRGAWLALLVVPVMTVLFLGRWRTKFIILVVFAVFMVCLFSLYKMGKLPAIEHGVSNIHNFVINPSHCSSWGARLAMWKISLTTLSEAPFLGVGYTEWGAFAKHAVDQKTVQMTCPVLYEHTAHSIYFHTLATTGLVGLLGLVVLFLGCLIAILKAPARDAFKITPIALLIAYAVFGFSTTWLAKTLHVSVFVVLMSYFIGQCYRLDNMKQDESLDR